MNVRLTKVFAACKQVSGTPAPFSGPSTSDSTVRSSTRWFKFNDGTLFPGPNPRRFFESDREVLHTFSLNPYKDLTSRQGGGGGAMIFRRLGLLVKIGAR